MTLYRIRTTGSKAAPFSKPHWVCDWRKQWDASWYTRSVYDAQKWKTKGGAERWLAGRPEIVGTVEEVK